MFYISVGLQLLYSSLSLFPSLLSAFLSEHAIMTESDFSILFLPSHTQPCFHSTTNQKFSTRSNLYIAIFVILNHDDVHQPFLLHLHESERIKHQITHN